MRTVSLTVPADRPSPRLARLTRHLHARLLDFGPGGPEVLCADQSRGIVTARFPGHDTAQVIDELEHRCRVSVTLSDDGELARFCLGNDTPFEDLDYVWGCLFDLL